MRNLTNLSTQLKNKTVLIIDGMNLFHRQYHIFKQYPYGTAFGFMNTIISLSDSTQTNKVIICWDGDKNWRQDEYAEYKDVRREQRKKEFSDEDRQQFSKSLEATKNLLLNIGVIQILQNGLEADDLIAYFTKKINSDVVIVSNDKDFLQLVDDKKQISVMRPMGKGEYLNMDEATVKEKFGITPTDFPKFLAIAGDVSDNVKGVKNMGQVKALKLINDGQITKDNLRKIFNKEQIKQFVSSYKLVKLGDDKIHSIKIVPKSMIMLSNIIRLKSKPIYKNRVQAVLDEYSIKKFKFYDLDKYLNFEFIETVRNMLYKVDV